MSDVVSFPFPTVLTVVERSVFLETLYLSIPPARCKSVLEKSARSNQSGPWPHFSEEKSPSANLLTKQDDMFLRLPILSRPRHTDASQIPPPP
jgi:hypothetical protein